MTVTVGFDPRPAGAGDLGVAAAAVVYRPRPGALEVLAPPREGTAA